MCFGTAWQHFHTDAYRPVSLYAATHRRFEDLAAYYAAPTACACSPSSFDTYGPGAGRAKLVADLANAARDRTRLALSPGRQQINLTHADDVVRAVCVALDRSPGSRPERWSPLPCNRGSEADAGPYPVEAPTIGREERGPHDVALSRPSSQDEGLAFIRRAPTHQS